MGAPLCLPQWSQICQTTYYPCDRIEALPMCPVGQKLIEPLQLEVRGVTDLEENLDGLVLVLEIVEELLGVLTEAEGL
jgi:hypothetical protein